MPRSARSYDDLQNMAARRGDTRRTVPALSEGVSDLPCRGLDVCFQSSETAGPSGPAFFGIDVELPLPPSVNNLYFNSNKAGRLPAKHYVAWRREAGWLLVAARQGKVRGRYLFLLLIPEKCPGDPDNRLKAPSDLLVNNHLIEDDSKADFVAALRSRSVPAGQCRLVVLPSDRLSDILNIALRASGGDVARGPAAPASGRAEAG